MPERVAEVEAVESVESVESVEVSGQATEAVTRH